MIVLEAAWGGELGLGLGLGGGLEGEGGGGAWAEDCP